MTSTPPPPNEPPPGQFGPQYGAPPASGRYGPPAGSPYGGQPQYGPPAGYGAPAPGPSPYATAPAGPVRPLAPFWVILFIALAVVGLIAIVLPWFHPTIDGHKIDGVKDFHSWNGLLFFLAPVVMIIAAGRAITARTNLAQFRQAGISGILSGALMLISAVIGYARVPSAYSDWDQAKAIAAEHGQTLGRGPEIGWYLTIGVGVLFIVLGIAAIVQARSRAARP
jgi:hypothetical protein